MKTNRNRNIPIQVERALWGISAGRCEFEGCNCYLGINPITTSEGNYAEKAHIEAVSEGGARYREVMDVDSLNSVDNIMLMCAKCHKNIDENPELYSVSKLQEMKRKHEERVYWMTEFSGVQKSFMVGYFANIKERHPCYDEKLFLNAVIRNRNIPSERHIKLIGNENMPFNDGSEEFYTVQVATLKVGIEKKVKPCLDKDENIAVFALAPMPLLIKLGELLSDISNVVVYQCHRKEEKWTWDVENNDKIDFIIQHPDILGQKYVALNISLSANITQQRINNVVGDIPTYKITIDEPNRQFVKNKSIIDDFIVTFRKCIEQIKNDNPQIEKILVFPSMPNSLAIRMGMDYMPKTDPL